MVDLFNQTIYCIVRNPIPHRTNSMNRWHPGNGFQPNLEDQDIDNDVNNNNNNNNHNDNDHNNNDSPYDTEGWGTYDTVNNHDARNYFRGQGPNQDFVAGSRGRFDPENSPNQQQRQQKQRALSGRPSPNGIGHNQPQRADTRPPDQKRTFLPGMMRAQNTAFDSGDNNRISKGVHGIKNPDTIRDGQPNRVSPFVKSPARISERGQPNPNQRFPSLGPRKTVLPVNLPTLPLKDGDSTGGFERMPQAGTMAPGGQQSFKEKKTVIRRAEYEGEEKEREGEKKTGLPLRKPSSTLLIALTPKNALRRIKNKGTIKLDKENIRIIRQDLTHHDPMSPSHMV